MVWIGLGQFYQLINQSIHPSINHSIKSKVSYPVVALFPLAHSPTSLHSLHFTSVSQRRGKKRKGKERKVPVFFFQLVKKLGSEEKEGGRRKGGRG